MNIKLLAAVLIWFWGFGEKVFSQNPTIQISPFQTTIYPNQAAVYNVEVINPGTFNQQLFFNISSTTLPIANYSSSFNPNPLNFPYTGGSNLTIQTNGGIPIGNYEIVVTASNGPVSISDTCFLNVITPQCYWTNYQIPNTLNVYGYFMNTDNNGNKWFTAGGLTKFDGTNWTNYNTTNSNLPSPYFSKVSFDQQNNIWIPTRYDGIAKFDGTFWTSYNVTNSTIPTDTINWLVIDSANNKWIGTKDKGLIKFDGTSWIVYDTSNSPLTSNYISSLNFDNTGKLWMVGYASTEIADFIASFDGSNWIFYNSSNSCFNFNCGSISNLEFDQVNNLWFCIGWSSSCSSPNKGVVKFNGNSWEIWLDSTITPYNHYIKNLSCGIIAQDNQSKLPTSNNREVLIDSHNIKWIATMDDLAGAGNGLLKFDGINWEIFTPSNSNLPKIAIRGLSVFNDTLWVLNSPDFYGWSGPNYLSSYYCNTPLGISNQTNIENTITISPNPATDKITISFPATASENIPTKIFSITGEVVFEEKNKSATPVTNYQIPIFNLSNGIYFLSVQTEREVVTKKIVVQH